MPVQVSPVLETLITAFVLAHETGVSLMSYPVLFQPTFKQEDVWPQSNILMTQLLGE